MPFVKLRGYFLIYSKVKIYWYINMNVKILNKISLPNLSKYKTKLNFFWK